MVDADRALALALQAENATSRQSDLVRVAENTRKNLENEINGWVGGGSMTLMDSSRVACFAPFVQPRSLPRGLGGHHGWRQPWRVWRV
jgi:hypothetical protein